MSDDDLITQIALDGLRSNRGRPKSRPGLYLTYVRDMTLADVDLLNAGIPVGATPAPLQSIRHTHHMLAQLLAEGKGNVEVAQITGYTPQRVWDLQRDPAFKELVAHYRGIAEAQFVDVHSRLAALGLNTIEELAERLEVAPGKFSNKELFELAALTLDRSSAPPKGAKSAPPNGPGIALSINFVPPPQRAGALDRVIDVTPQLEEKK